jgi:hypothetical protein
MDTVKPGPGKGYGWHYVKLCSYDSAAHVHVDQVDAIDPVVGCYALAGFGVDR